MSEINWYNIENIEELDTPALVIFPERVKENIRLLTGMIDDRTRLRPHVKTHKTVEVTKLLLEAGIQKFKCATIAEAEMLALSGAKDVLLAYQPVGAKFLRFLTLIQHFPQTQFSCLVDALEIGQNISETAGEHQLTIPLFIDLNTGMNRTGIIPEKAFSLFLALQKLPNITIAGLHIYDGNIRDFELEVRRENCDKAFEPVELLVQKIQQEGFPAPKIVAGGTPTFPVHAQREKVECSPGTFVYWDKGYESSFPEQAFLTAALVISRVISIPDSNKICLDLGHKSIAAENDLSRRVFFLNAPDLKFIGQSEEHLVLETPENHTFKIGDVFYGLPIHICPTCALHERGYVVEKRKLNGVEWKVISRDRKINY